MSTTRAPRWCFILRVAVREEPPRSHHKRFYASPAHSYATSPDLKLRYYCILFSLHTNIKLFIFIYYLDFPHSACIVMQTEGDARGASLSSPPLLLRRDLTEWLIRFHWPDIEDNLALWAQYIHEHLLSLATFSFSSSTALPQTNCPTGFEFTVDTEIENIPPQNVARPIYGIAAQQYGHKKPAPIPLFCDFDEDTDSSVLPSVYASTFAHASASAAAPAASAIPGSPSLLARQGRILAPVVSLPVWRLCLQDDLARTRALMPRLAGWFLATPPTQSTFLT